MHNASKVTIGIGIVLIIIAIIVVAMGDSFEENITEGIIYEGTDGSVTIEEIKNGTESMYYVHLVNAKYDGGSQGGYNERHYNSTWNLTEEDCNIVKAFSIKDNDNNEMFYPKCNYVEDGTEDHYIVVGHLCNARNAYTDDEGMTHQSWSGNGCPGGTFNFETNGNEVMVFDIGALLGAIGGWFVKWIGSVLACCCGSIILLIGIVLAFTMDDPKEPAIKSTTNMPESSSGWEQQDDYIHRKTKIADDIISEKSEMAIPESEEEKPKEKKRSGEYDLPPPPEY